MTAHLTRQAHCPHTGPSLDGYPPSPLPCPTTTTTTVPPTHGHTTPPATAFTGAPVGFFVAIVAILLVVGLTALFTRRWGR